ncbi:MAG: alpha-E domain-containing protein, partial [Bacteroidetes bacterium]|nr:alpha-E domain-containing protein [Bacteroidota bacterium]
FDFIRIGTYLERADNTARILDVKYYTLLPSVFAVGSSIDNVQWDTILQSVSAKGGFRMEYGNTAGPRDIASFLILDKRMPRSLAFCVGKIRDNFGYLVTDHGCRNTSTDMVDALYSQCSDRTIEAIFDQGLHEYLQDVLKRLGDLGGQIELDYRFYS